jgi:hypothetical protein
MEEKVHEMHFAHLCMGIGVYGPVGADCMNGLTTQRAYVSFLVSVV